MKYDIYTNCKAWSHAIILLTVNLPRVNGITLLRVTLTETICL